MLFGSKAEEHELISAATSAHHFISGLQHSEGQWAEPRNKNKLEKQTLARQGPSAQSKGLKDETAVNDEEVKQGYQDAADGVKNKAQEAGDAIAGAVDKIRPDKN